MIIEHVIQFLSDPVNLIVTISALILSGVFFMLSINSETSAKMKVAFLFMHLLLLAFPLYYFGFQTNCQVPILNCDFKTVATFIPVGLFGVFVIGFFAVPGLYLRMNRKNEINDAHINKIITKYSKNYKIKKPRIYLLNTAKPVAYSMSNFLSAIFISAGMLDLLSKREIEAVLLHELAHIKSGSSLKKFSTLFVKTFSPLSAFASFGGLDAEEKMADAFAVSVQGTDRFVNSAKSKIDSWNRFDDSY